MSKKNVLAGWAKTGLFPFNPDRVLKGIAKPDLEPPTMLTNPIDYANSGFNPQGDVMQTPTTPVSSDALKSLLTMIKQEPHDEVSGQRQRRLVHKLANAAEISFARQALDQDQIQFLSNINDEAKTRRKTKSDILGKARVTSYEDIEAARTKRAEQATNKEAKGKRKRGRPKRATAEDEGDYQKRKCAVQEIKEAAVVQTNGTDTEEDLEPCLYRAPVARMW